MSRMIPLKIADMAVAACNEEIAKLQAENVSLKSDVDRLTQELKDEKSANANVEGRQQSANRNLGMENARLKAEVERLRKAGDVMLLALWLGVDEYSKEQKEKAEEEWNAAKEGKQS